MTDLDLIPQPDFGERLRQLRQQRGLKQSDLTGGAISASYISRIESGSRVVTPHVAEILIERLGVDISAFQENRDTALAHLLTLGQQWLLAGNYATAADTFRSALEKSPGAPLAIGWLIRQSLAIVLSNLGQLDEWRRHQTVLVSLAVESDNPDLLVSAYTGLSRCLRMSGEIDDANAAAWSAVEHAESTEVSHISWVNAMIVLIAAESEAGRAGEAAGHAVDLLGGLTDDTPPWLRAQALWAAASAQVNRQGFEKTMALLRKAMAELHTGQDLITWARLRLAAVSLSYRAGHPVDQETQDAVVMASRVLRITGIPIYQAQLDLIEAEMAFDQQRYADAEGWCDSALAQVDLLSFRDRAQTRILRARAMEETHRQDLAIDELRHVAEELDAAGARDLLAEVWRLIAECALTRRGQS